MTFCHHTIAHSRVSRSLGETEELGPVRSVEVLVRPATVTGAVLVLLITLVAVTPGPAEAQTPGTLAEWDLPGTVVEEVPATGVAPHLSASPMRRVGLDVPSWHGPVDGFDAVGWSTTFDPEKHLEVTITPEPGHAIDLAAIAPACAGASGDWRAQLTLVSEHGATVLWAPTGERGMGLCLASGTMDVDLPPTTQTIRLQLRFEVPSTEVVAGWAGPETGPPVRPVVAFLGDVVAVPPRVDVAFPPPAHGLGGWHNAADTLPVEGVVTATEDVTTVTGLTCTPASALGMVTGIGTPSAVGALAVADEGTTTVTCQATNDHGGDGVGLDSTASATVRIDTHPPTIDVASPAQGAAVVLGGVLPLEYDCTDPPGGSGLAACTGAVPTGAALDTSTVGPQQATVTATDQAGNRTTTTRTYVVRYDVTWTTAPAAGSVLRPGRPVRLGWTLADAAGTTLTDPAAVLAVLVDSATACTEPFGTPVPAAGGPVTVDPATQELVFEWDTSGLPTGCHRVHVELDDGTRRSLLVRVSDPPTPPPAAPPEPDPEPEPPPPPLDATDNVDRAIAVARTLYPTAAFDRVEDGPDVVLLGRDDLFADSLASGGAQGLLDAPLLLTGPAGLDPRTAAEIARLGAVEVVLLGGEEALPPLVADDLADAGVHVRRLAGASRIETAIAIADDVAPDATRAVLARAHAHPGSPDPTQAFADALAAGALAADLRVPLLLTEPDVLTPAVATYLADSAITEVVVVGGEAAVGPAVRDALTASGIRVVDAGGPTRAATAVAIATLRGAARAAEAAMVLVGDGEHPDAWADAFPAALWAARADAPLVLTAGAGVPGPTAEWLAGGGDPPTCLSLVHPAACALVRAAVDG